MSKFQAVPAGADTCRPIHVQLMPIDQIDEGPHPWHVRGEDEQDVEQLTRSLELNGGRFEHPLVVRPHPLESQRAQLISGSRRIRAARAARLVSVPVVIRDLTDSQARLVVLTENLSRQAPRSLLRLGWVILPLLEETWGEQKHLANLIGCSESKISEALKYARMLPEAEAEQIAGDHGVSKSVLGALPRKVLKNIKKLPPDERRKAARDVCCKATQQEGKSLGGAEAGQKKATESPVPRSNGPYEIRSDGGAITLSIANASSMRVVEFMRLLRDLVRVCLSSWREHRRRSPVVAQDKDSGEAAKRMSNEVRVQVKDVSSGRGTGVRAA